jgi:hypothetical protein
MVWNNASVAPREMGFPGDPSVENFICLIHTALYFSIQEPLDQRMRSFSRNFSIL